MISWVLVAIVILNLIDMFTTVYLVSQEGFMEANPMMRELIETGQFVPVKILVSLAVSPYPRSPHQEILREQGRFCCKALRPRNPHLPCHLPNCCGREQHNALRV
jgi:hypothetical protein